MRRASKVDGNHEAIASVFRAAGFSVQSTAMVGNGCPDFFAAYDGHTFGIEVKTPGSGRFTPLQKKWHAQWKGRAHVVETVDQAYLLIGLYRKANAA